MTSFRRFLSNAFKVRPVQLSSFPQRQLHTTSIARMPRTAETASFKFNHTMFRIKDPKVSLPFYTEILGMDIISESNMGDFTLYFLGFDHDGIMQLSGEERSKARFNREGILELTHNHGTESDASFQGYSSGNSDPGRGFGHIAITVDNIEQACERLEKLGVPFKKRLTDGKMKHIAFILDPDGYWIEIVPGALKL
ncbi:Glyoxalase/Bleomycin resistance protein/Dihydroxybiphenyl dioxygenase [Hygrophoropsis aurantiaca]|uniref:Glyoxalase/Bleomycin resistance protein/Dihydroxybiphenyl dioxygenase n=1 Tax=Hygrophoropsis aurantiaca TaxID=72124 RepID=A0ACB8A064_9AGAM|nr:Glyoxalase/Bleomycin resistance protein/Dihydroxybiphenyl dioxygenase [Hygrophoropsis aurantiaca]